MSLKQNKVRKRKKGCNISYETSFFSRLKVSVPSG